MKTWAIVMPFCVTVWDGEPPRNLNSNGFKPVVIDGEVTPLEAVQQFVGGNLKPASGFCRCHQ